MYQSLHKDLISVDALAGKYIRTLQSMYGGLHLGAFHVCMLLALQEQREQGAEDGIERQPLRSCMEAQDAEIQAQRREIQAQRREIERLRINLSEKSDKVTLLERQLAKAESDYDAAQTAKAELMQQLSQLDADNAGLTQRLASSVTLPSLPPMATLTTNDNGNVHQVAVAEASADEIDWSTLSPMADDYRISVEDGRRPWRQVPKEFRLELVQCVLGQKTPDGTPMTMSFFDFIKPTWIPSANGMPITFGCSWSTLPVFSLA